MNRYIFKTVILSGVVALAGAIGPACTENVEIPDAQPVAELPDWEDNVDGSVYDYTLTNAPETPYNHDYANSMVLKLFMARPNTVEGGSNVSLTYEDALRVIKGIDEISRGVKKIVYLVGWQYDGHDWKYPAFFEFNEALKRDEDATAADSYHWLREEAKKYNTVVSVHVLLGDAYPNSPLWHEYVKNGFICRDAQGNLTPLAVFNGQQVYNVNNTREWQKGALQARLEKLIDLCDLKDAGTIHFDAFFGRASAYDDLTAEEMEVTLRKVLRWMRSKGIDVTAEFFHNTERVDPFYGLQACAWWDDRTPAERIAMPQGLADGGNIGRFSRWAEDIFLFGDSYGAENDFNFVDYDPTRNWAAAWGAAKLGIATQVIPMLYFHQSRPIDYDSSKKTVTYENGTVSDYNNQTVRHGNVLLRDHDNTFFPLVQTKDGVPEIMAYSKNGYANRRWTLPDDWKNLTSVEMIPLSEEGLGQCSTLAVTDGTVTLSLNANSMVILRKL